MKKRKEWIDILRGIAMLLVIFGHQCPGWNSFFVFTSPIKIPLFFAITGYVFNAREGNQKIFYNNLLLKLVVPWIALSLMPLQILKYIFIDNSTIGVINYLFDFLTGRVFWYLPCCITAEIIVFYIHKFSNNRLKCVVVSSLLLTCIGIFCNSFGLIRLRFLFNALTVQVFILLGYLIRKFEDRLVKVKLYQIGILIMTYIVIGVISTILYPYSSIDVHTGQYYNYLISFAMIVIGCSSLFILGKKYDIKNLALSYIGQNTLVYFMLNGYAFWIINKTSIFIPAFKQETILGWTLKTVLASIIMAFVAAFINRYLPMLVGRRSKSPGLFLFRTRKD